MQSREGHRRKNEPMLARDLVLQSRNMCARVAARSFLQCGQTNPQAQDHDPEVLGKVG